MIILTWLDAEVQMPFQTVRVLFAVALLGARDWSAPTEVVHQLG